MDLFDEQQKRPAKEHSETFYKFWLVIATLISLSFAAMFVVAMWEGIKITIEAIMINM